MMKWTENCFKNDLKITITKTMLCDTHIGNEIVIFFPANIAYMESENNDKTCHVHASNRAFMSGRLMTISSLGGC